jgi:hypothetical protein
MVLYVAVNSVTEEEAHVPHLETVDLPCVLKDTGNDLLSLGEEDFFSIPQPLGPCCTYNILHGD